MLVGRSNSFVQIGFESSLGTTLGGPIDQLPGVDLFEVIFDPIP